MKSVPFNIRVSATQIVTYTGRNILSVEISKDSPEYLEIVRKRFRGDVYDKQFIPLSKVIAYSVGEGGESGAYVTLRTESLLKEINGTGIINGNYAHIVDDKGVAHIININPNISGLNVTIVSPKFKEIEMDDEPVVKRSKFKEKVLKVAKKQPIKNRLRNRERF